VAAGPGDLHSTITSIRKGNNLSTGLQRKAHQEFLTIESIETIIKIHKNKILPLGKVFHTNPLTPIHATDQTISNECHQQDIKLTGSQGKGLS